MKKNKIWIIAVCVCIVALCAVFALNHSKVNNVTDNDGTTYKSEIQKARNIPNCVRLSEGKDFTFSDENSSAENEEIFTSRMGALSDSVFDFVFIKTKTLLRSEASDDEIEKTAENLKVFSDLAETKNLIAEYDVSLPAEKLDPILKSGILSGVAIRNTKSAKPKAIAEAVSQLKKITDETFTIILELEEDYKAIDKLDFTDINFLCANLNRTDEKGILSFFDFFCEAAKQNKVGFVPFFRADYCTSQKAPCSYLLDCVRTAEEYDAVSMRGFSAFSDVLTDIDNSFSSVEKFITDGLDISNAMAKLCIEGYDGTTRTTNDYSVSIVITGSDVYPLYLEGEKIFLSNGQASLNLRLKNGMNKFRLVQGESKLTFKIKVDFNKEVIRSISPSDVVYARKNKTFKVTVVAAAGADVFVKLGASRMEAKRVGDENEGYCEYSAKITAPKSEVEIRSIGKLSVIATLDGESFTKDGPNVIYSDSSAENETSSAEKVTIGNFIDSPAAKPAEPIIEQNYTPVSQYTGNQMCIVHSGYADTWSASESDSDYIPYYTTLAPSTIDYVVGQCQVYDSEEEETRDFYILASGRKVQTKSVQLIQNQNFSDNSLEVVSSQSTNGDLTLKIKTKWHVPYSFSFAPQNYYAANYKKYNVENFTADRIQFTFYHTVSVSGSVDANGSDVVSTASWSVDSAKKTASLIMPLKQAGKYYGYTLRYDADGSILLTVQNKPKTLSGSVIVLDPGHGGKDGGANGLSGSVKESQINFAVSVALKNELERRGATVYLTRSDDTEITLEERKSFARQLNPDLFISVHANASVDASKFGTAVYYFRPMSAPLSKSVYDKLYSLFASAYGSSYSSAVTGSFYHPFSVTRLEECPSILIETGFVTNESECMLLLDSGNRDKIAAAIADGVEEYFRA